MIPILYESTLADATFLTNGICRLSDTLSCVVTEERNGEYTLTLEYPFSGIHADEITVQRIIKAKANDKSDLQCFRIGSVTQSLDGKRLIVKANHISYDLSYFPVTPFSTTAVGVAYVINAILNNSVNTSGFYNASDVIANTVTWRTDIPKSIKNCLLGQEGSVLQRFGGEFEWDNRLIKWHEPRGADNGVVIAYGKNLTDYEQETNIADVYTGILPYFSSDGTVVYGDIQYSDNSASFPFLKSVCMDFTADFDVENPPTAAQLNARAQTYISANSVGTPKVSFDISFFPLGQLPEYSVLGNIEQVGLCDTVTVLFTELGVRAKAKVVKTIYNSILERYESIELGTVRSNISDTIAGLMDSSGSGSSSGGGSVDAYTKTETNALLAAKQDKLVKLWENSAPTSAFAAQTILNDGTIADYDLFAIKFKEQANSTGSSEFVFWYTKTSNGNTTARWVSRTGSNIFFNTRSFSITDSGGITFTAGGRNTQGTSSETANNLYMVPLEVYGTKL